MAIANKALVWGLFAAGGTLTAFLFPAVILVFLLTSAGWNLTGLEFTTIQAALQKSMAKILVFAVLFLSMWHAAHRFRVLVHDLGLRADATVALVAYLIAAIGTVTAAWFLLSLS